MNWQIIKEEIYYQDGSWRDIYVLGTTWEDWRKWILLVNQTYQVKFYNGLTQQTEIGINTEAVHSYLTGKTDLTNSATVKLGAITIKCYFFTDQEIEIDIDPREIVSIEDHNLFIEYMTTVSICLNKPVIMTAESSQDTIYILIDGENVKFV